MFIDRDISKFAVFMEDSILSALNKINANKLGFAVAVTEHGRVYGLITDGDFRRWITASNNLDFNRPVAQVCNIDCKLAQSTDSPTQIQALFSSKVRVVPIVDDYFRLVGVALPRSANLTIAERVIGKGHPSYVIAEIGNNHNGRVDAAKELVDAAKEAGADCVKFQLRNLKTLYGSGTSSDANQDLGSQYTMDLLSRFNLAPDDLFRVFDYALTRNIQPLCTPWDMPSLVALEKYGLPGYKVASADLTNHEFLSELAKTRKSLICSTGMSTENEIKESVAMLQANGAAFGLLHCNSTYPTPYKDVNLFYMDRLSEIGDCPVGYSGHERGWSVPIAAVARGAAIIEKHLTLDRSQEGNDHKVSLMPDEFVSMVAAIRAVEDSLGVLEERVITQGEMMNRETLAKSLVAARDISEGEVIADLMIATQSPGQGLQPNQRSQLLGRVAKRNISARTPFFPSDLTENSIGPRAFNFDRVWGLPVRWHDYKKMLDVAEPPLLEYHLSYKDMDASLADWFDSQLASEFVVHAPELFEGDHTLDLSSINEPYRRRSVTELQRVIDIARSLKRWHPLSKRPCIVVNMGGFTQARAIPVDDRALLYQNIELSLDELDTVGVELIPQTMPPFPWHFGGQSFHNLFVDPDEILDFCTRNTMRICFDVSHSQLACNHFGWSMKEFSEKVAPVTAHLHIADAKGVDGEGLQIGEGGIDFAMLASTLRAICPAASFIPEIWQGHKDSGAGFWFALDKLERWMGAH